MYIMRITLIIAGGVLLLAQASDFFLSDVKISGGRDTPEVFPRPSEWGLPCLCCAVAAPHSSPSPPLATGAHYIRCILYIHYRH